MLTLFEDNETRVPLPQQPSWMASEQDTGSDRRRRLLRRAEYALLAIGFVCLAVVAVAWLESTAFQSYEEYKLDSMIQGREATLMGYAGFLWSDLTSGEPSADDYAELQKPAPPSIRKTVAPRELIGKIEIPRVNVATIIREGVDSKTLRRAAGHVPGTALPGEDGNVAVAAHRDTYFRGLKNIKENDVIRVTTPDGTHEYVVRSMQIVKPTQVEVLDPQRKRELTLITCYPFNYVGNAPKRYIVRAEQLDKQKAAPAVFGADPQPLASKSR